MSIREELQKVHAELENLDLLFADLQERRGQLIRRQYLLLEQLEPTLEDRHVAGQRVV